MVGVPEGLIIMPQAVVKERHHIDWVQPFVPFPVREFQMIKPGGVVNASLEEIVLLRSLHLHDECIVIMVHTDQVEHRLFPVGNIPSLLAVGIFLDVLNPRLRREDLVQHPDEDVLVVPVREHGLEAHIAPQVHERSELLSLFEIVHNVKI